MQRAAIALVLCASFCASLPVSAPVPQLYGTNTAGQLEAVDPSTANYTAFGTSLTSLMLIQSQGLTTVDAANNILYAAVLNQTAMDYELVAMNIDSGEVSVIAKLPVGVAVFVGVGMYIQFDSKTGDVIVVGHISNTQHEVFRVTPKDGKVVNVASFGDMDILGGASGFVPTESTLVMMVALNVSGTVRLDLQQIDVKTSKVYPPVSDVDYMESLSFDEKTNHLFGLGLTSHNGSYVRTLVKLEPNSGNQTIVANIPGYFVMSSNVQGLCTIGRKLFVLLQKGASWADPEKIPIATVAANMPFFAQLGADQSMYLVTIDLDTGKVVSEAKACEQLIDCPWSLQVGQTRK
eukprot:CAMPEP_0114559526 /NCGR_PEP_ID=MMETSP0114-20121206/10965_1 /TAXON_ID=31324 /ORGANISM="Goniomonas sp, Strain m" /LENGTH=348 /DNA_ID=CAMNT_0001744995 /DNA_START=14 /DNA_END=1060 /DNA_ORIENTATION=+